MQPVELKILTVVGARPQFIKAVMVSRAIRAHSLEADRYRPAEIMLHTGQHFDSNMSAIFFDELGMAEPAYHLGIAGGRHGEMTGRMLAGIEEVILREDPDWMLVYGDTNSTLAGALSAAKLHTPIAHVEAGLRSFNRRMPEEINRVLTDHAADLLLAPTAASVENLMREGIPAERIEMVGDVMYDAALHYGERAEKESPFLERIGLTSGEYLLATIHRAENTDDPQRLRAIIEGLVLVSRQMPVILPVHPRTRAALQAAQLEYAGAQLRLVDPLGYLDMVSAEKHARLIVTDSGGVQKEAFFHRTLCVTVRDESEWIELVELGWNHLVSPRSAEAVFSAVQDALRAPAGREAAPYGRGDAAGRIVQALVARASRR